MEYSLRKDTEFARDVSVGLSGNNKFLSSKYFYDHKGDELFQKIMQLPEYYLTRKEFSILEEHHRCIMERILDFPEFNMVEMGAGDGLKTKILLEYLYNQKANFTYYPIDISGNVLKQLETSLHVSYPGIEVSPIVSNYKNALQDPLWNRKTKTLLLFLGANIGNFVWDDAVKVLRKIARSLQEGDMALIGFDFKKDPELILRAYDDSQGVTKDFNLNILTRINKELGGNFDLTKFKHWPVYNPVNGECRSYLVSLVEQEVTIEALKQRFKFKKAEAIHTEVSKKYDKDELLLLAEDSGFEVLENFEDCDGYFTDSLWRKK
ncbi:L-histidine N(alpha)-methyltransferase [Echinicola sp. CAU 1574]|uniref:L-histidine N(Alpha)-methyltransferase n=1 Tax=Echinicola arenosa TaxID=2774144 RepID=A0ABR9ANX1_9BACT|nr:L-histidine N(alpha)-methyltransferase [Echinicola arenosa]MBD8490492.1 L-histidine N(alpha)-methyltransferase [Echinicola arenosa]